LNAKRLFFLDTVRAFAILMMLQGHFIDTMLLPAYRDLSKLPYAIWSYFRGITAPVFFTITGLVFCYLLFKAEKKGESKQRIKKGLTRGLMLIIVGYSLRVSFINWLSGYFDTYFLTVDVLQCIGLSLILIIAFYSLLRKNKLFLAIIFFSIGTLIFLFEPCYRTLECNNIPILFCNYISKSNGSVFTIIPWFGYVAFGSFLAIIFSVFENKKHFRPVMLLSFLVFGFSYTFLSSPLLRSVTNLTDISIFMESANYNYLFSRFGNVLLLFFVFYGLEKYLKQSIITKIGQKTLSIYIIHFIIIYGSYTGLGIKKFFYKSMTPTEVIFGALLFIITVCFISFHYAKTNGFIYTYLRKAIGWVKN
jgi:uncharacterized membrane protein